MGNVMTPQLIHLPAQSGKTRKMTELINKWSGFINEFGHTNSLNVVFTSNTKILTKQTANRIINDVDKTSVSSDYTSEKTEDDEEEDADTGDEDTDNDYSELDEISTICRTVAWIHKGKDSLSVNDIFAKITSDDDNEINNVICCTNKLRMKKVIDLLVMLYKKFNRRNYNKMVTIWIDEADSSIGIWKKFYAAGNPTQDISPMVEGKFIQNVVFITATMTPLYKYFNEKDIAFDLRVYPTTHLPVYLKFSECQLDHTIADDSNDIKTQLTRILDEHREMVVPGSKWFCPGNTARKSHEEIYRILSENGFNVLLLNGNSKEFRLIDGTVIPVYESCDDDEELSNILNTTYYDLRLNERPFAVTGNLCISRGVTFASKIPPDEEFMEQPDKEFMFTHGVIPNSTNGDEAYQMVARLLGNVKHYDSYSVPKIFISSSTTNLILKTEDMAIQFSQKYYTNGCEKVRITKDHELYDGLIGQKKKRKMRTKEGETSDDANWELTEQEFQTLDEANAFLSANECRRKLKFNKNDEGFMLCSTTKKLTVLSYDNVKSVLATWSKKSGFDLKDTSTKAGRIFACYRDTQDKSSDVFIVRIIKKREVSE